MKTPDEEKPSVPPSPPKRKENLLKVREMPDHVTIEETQDDKGEVCLKPLTKTRGLNKETYKPADLRQEIEPWLTALFQSEHFSLLVGSGLTTSVHMQIAGEACPCGKRA